VIYRVTARFLQSFDALDSRVQAQALLALRGFAETPRMPSPYSHVVNDTDPNTSEDDVWALPFGKGGHITYSFVNDPNKDEFVCILRNIGKIELAPYAPIFI
jgi:hypothetical protein